MYNQLSNNWNFSTEKWQFSGFFCIRKLCHFVIISFLVDLIWHKLSGYWKKSMSNSDCTATNNNIRHWMQNASNKKECFKWNNKTILWALCVDSKLQLLKIFQIQFWLSQLFSPLCTNTYSDSIVLQTFCSSVGPSANLRYIGIALYYQNRWFSPSPGRPVNEDIIHIYIDYENDMNSRINLNNFQYAKLAPLFSLQPPPPVCRLARSISHYLFAFFHNMP